jgi:hypothetical protein
MAQVYFLNGAFCALYGVESDAVTGTAWLSDLWPLGGGFEEGIDAGLNYGNGKAYLFRGSEYIRVDIATRSVETERRSIGEFWGGMAEAGFDSNLDAAVNAGNGNVYFFKGDAFGSYSIADDRLTGVGSLSAWALAADGSFDSDLDAVVNYGNGKLYVFKGGNYVRYDLAQGQVDSEVRSIAQFWTGMAEAGVTADVRGSWCDADPSGTAGRPAFTGGADIDAYFVRVTGSGFIDWFNATHADRGAFAPTPKRHFRMNTDPDTRARFVAFWDTIPFSLGATTARLVQFVGLQTIFINELGGAMVPASEMINPTTAASHAGIAYLFDAIPGLKASYNVAPNVSALACFNNDTFLAAHAAEPLHDQVARTTDQAWAGTAYPAGFPTGMQQAGIIAQADFCKFRGRGMIQTTWRANYRAIIQFVQAYAGADPTVLGYTQAWAGMTPDDVAHTSTNADWDTLFQHSNYVIPAAGIAAHARPTGYLNISDDPAVRAGTGKGSFHEMGLRISGSGAYGTLFSQRCEQIMASLP